MSRNTLSKRIHLLITHTHVVGHGSKTIMMCFLEDEEMNDNHGYRTFASGELATFMKGTKSIADAQVLAAQRPPYSDRAT